MRLSLFTFALVAMVMASCSKKTIAPEGNTVGTNNEVQHDELNTIETALLGTWEGQLNNETVTIQFHQTSLLRNNENFQTAIINDDEVEWMVDEENFILIGGDKYYYTIDETYEEMTLSGLDNPGVQGFLERSSM